VSEPAPDADLELAKIRLGKELDAAEAVRAAERTSDYGALQADDDAELELAKLFHQTVTTTAVAGIDRVRDSATFVQTAATAILGLYTGLLALVFSVTDHPLPFRGVYAGIYLGLAIALATAYLAYLTSPPLVEIELDQRSRPQLQVSRTAFLVRWVGATTRARSWALRGAVLCLVGGVAFIAAPFVAPGAVTDLPPEVTPPSVPSQVAPGFEHAAQKLYASQLADYRNAVADRKTVLDDRAEQLDHQKAASRWIEGLSLLVFLAYGAVAFVLARRGRTD